ncbi:peptidyl-prolyl cis-trans isomerase [Anaeromicropila populeti]|uniref:PPIC-type PPIASE domain-containing protein n=1 Tax=Anaeromicropila populeti TaxID=37658 RepID=A0A1I6JCA3_9FIRM|nr:peptidyl-prolyl cis-trans isomerase [Anaeromicropila populeti]SFR76572.1 PPIC-type PPIASE domain-containing protein [Anaeromicropila populeti]
MNSSKTTLKGNKKEVKKKNMPVEKTSTGKIVAIAICAVLVLAMLVGVAYDQLKPTLLFKLDGENIYLSDAMYYIYDKEVTYDAYDQMYLAYTGTGYWDSTSDSGTTNREAAKQEVYTTVKEYAILYKEAINAGYALTEEDKTTASETAEEVLKNLTTKQKSLPGLSKKKLTSVLEKKAVADRYKQDMIDSFDIDDQAIKDTFNYEDYRQYDFQYYYTSKTTYDEEGNSVALSDDEKAKLLEEMNALLEKSKTEDFAALLPSTETEEGTAATEAAATEETTATEETETSNISFQEEGNITPSSTTFEDEVKTKIMAMSNNEISQVLEDSNGYYIVKMINNNSDETYNQTVEDAIAEEENSQYETKFVEIAANYDFSAVDKNWNEIVLGDTVLE